MSSSPACMSSAARSKSHGRSCNHQLETSQLGRTRDKNLNKRHQSIFNTVAGLRVQSQSTKTCIEWKWLTHWAVPKRFFQFQHHVSACLFTIQLCHARNICWNVQSHLKNDAKIASRPATILQTSRLYVTCRCHEGTPPAQKSCGALPNAKVCQRSVKGNARSARALNVWCATVVYQTVDAERVGGLRKSSIFRVLLLQRCFDIWSKRI